MGCIIMKGMAWSFDEIQSGHWKSSDPYLNETLLFCKDWLTGKKIFEIKTSGSTGIPKTIRIERSQLISSARATAGFFGIKKSLSLLCCLNTDLIAGKMMLVRALEWDAYLHLVAPTANPFISISPDQILDFVALVPYQLEVSLKNPKSTALLNQVKTLLLGGAPLSPSLREKAILLAGNIFQTYGMTETVSHVALANIKARGNLVYHTLPDVKIRLSPGNSLEIKAEMSGNSWISTHDMVELLGPTQFIWKGRSDFTINSGGIKIQPEEVEALIGEVVIENFPGRRFFIGSLKDPSLGQKAILLIEGKRPSLLPTEELLTQFKEILPEYQGPKEILFLDTFIETGSGKINRIETLSKLSANNNI